jgi:hypothetical protein
VVPYKLSFLYIPVHYRINAIPGMEMFSAFPYCVLVAAGIVGVIMDILSILAATCGSEEPIRAI